MPTNEMDLRDQFEAFIRQGKALKSRKQLHAKVEARLTQLLHKLYPDSHAIPEVFGVPGGRHDIMQFFFHGRRVVFELFFSPSQVPQDLRLLELSPAEVKIAILLDPEINPRLVEDYFRKKPAQPFPYLMLSQVMLPAWERVCLARLRELIDEHATVQLARRILEATTGTKAEEVIRDHLHRIEERVQQVTPPTIRLDELTGPQWLALRIVEQVRKLGMPAERFVHSMYRSKSRWSESQC